MGYFHYVVFPRRSRGRIRSRRPPTRIISNDDDERLQSSSFHDNLSSLCNTSDVRRRQKNDDDDGGEREQILGEEGWGGSSRRVRRRRKREGAGRGKAGSGVVYGIPAVFIRICYMTISSPLRTIMMMTTTMMRRRWQMRFTTSTPSSLRPIKRCCLPSAFLSLSDSSNLASSSLMSAL